MLFVTKLQYSYEPNEPLSDSNTKKDLSKIRVKSKTKKPNFHVCKNC